MLLISLCLWADVNSSTAPDHIYHTIGGPEAAGDADASSPATDHEPQAAAVSSVYAQVSKKLTQTTPTATVHTPEQVQEEEEEEQEESSPPLPGRTTEMEAWWRTEDSDQRQKDQRNVTDWDNGWKTEVEERNTRDEPMEDDVRDETGINNDNVRVFVNKQSFTPTFPIMQLDVYSNISHNAAGCFQRQRMMSMCKTGETLL